MNFKKDYINFVLNSIVKSYSNSSNLRVKKTLESIINSDDLVKITYLIGKTAGLEVLFKYLLYISDKIDKSQVSIDNLRDNYDYDIQNLKKICDELQSYKSQSFTDKLAADVESKTETVEKSDEEINPAIEVQKPDSENTETEEKIIDVDEIPESTVSTEEEGDGTESDSAEASIIDSGEEEQPLTLIENTENDSSDEELYDLENIHKSLEEQDKQEAEQPVVIDIVSEDELIEIKADESDISDIIDEPEKDEEFVIQLPELPEDEAEIPDTDVTPEIVKKAEEELLGFELEIRSPSGSDPVPVSNEEYYKFETKFFEDIKILEKLFLYVENECAGGVINKLNNKLFHTFTAIKEITKDLSDETRQLSFDLTADIFLTINLFFTKAARMPPLLTKENLDLLNSSLYLVASLIKGENYLNYDVIVDKIEILKDELLKIPSKPETSKQQQELFKHKLSKKQSPAEEEGNLRAVPESQVPPISPASRIKKVVDTSSIDFKLKYLVKDFEKNFNQINELSGEYKVFDALDKIDDLNNTLRMIARLSASVRLNDVSRLGEVAYVFLKYLKDYRMNLLDPEIQQIIKYVIFTFKMLLTNRKPDDFSVLVDYLYNPVKIFTDTQ